MKGLVILSNGDCFVEEFVDVEHAQNQYINGWLEGIRLDGAFAYVDEEGKLKKLPINRVATEFVSVDRVGFKDYDAICGNMVVFGEVGPDGEHDTDCPNALISIARLIGNWKET